MSENPNALGRYHFIPPVAMAMEAIALRELLNPPPSGSSNPKDQIGIKKVPLHLLYPAALLIEAKALHNGAVRYTAFNWRSQSIAASIYVSAAERHLLALWDGENFAEDSQVEHIGHSRACAAILLDAQTIGNIVDDRDHELATYRGIVRRGIKSIQPGVPLSQWNMSDLYDAAMGRLLLWYSGEDEDVHTNVHNLGYFRAYLAAMTTLSTAQDDRPPSGAVPKILSQYASK